MPRARLISPEFRTSEAVVDCAPMARLLLLGTGTFADEFGVLPLRPRTLPAPDHGKPSQSPPRPPFGRLFPCGRPRPLTFAGRGNTATRRPSRRGPGA
jgi:hypothetical protein